MILRVWAGLPLAVFVGLVLAAGPAAAQDAPSVADRPNFVIFLADDLGWHDVEYHGSPIRTPNIDAMVDLGVELDRFYVYPTCSPTRAALMTGRPPSRWGILGPIAGGDTSSIPHAQETLPEMLKRGGYQTALVGKWHLGIMPDDLPNRHGFDYSYGSLHGQVDPHTHRYKHGDETWHRNGTFLKDEGHATDLIAGDAIRWLKEDRKAGEPFFLYVAFTVPHFPLAEGQEWMVPYRAAMQEHGREPYEAATTHMDAAIGRIVAAMREQGLLEKTLMVFSSDNGGQDFWNASKSEYEGRYPPTDQLGDNAPLRDWKASVYEGAIRVPAAVCWPEKLKPGRIEARIRVEDLLPTFAGRAGIVPAPAMNYEGIDVWPILTGAQPGTDRTIYVHHLTDYALIKDGWKLILPGGRDADAQLYRLDDDPNEAKDLGRRRPDRVKSLRRELAAQMALDPPAAAN